MALQIIFSRKDEIFLLQKSISKIIMNSFLFFQVILFVSLVCQMVVFGQVDVQELGLDKTVFKRVTSTGINFTHSRGHRTSLLPEDMGSGAGFADYDGDGDLDLYIVNNPGPLAQQVTDMSTKNVLYRNNGNGRFTDVTIEANVGDYGYGMGCVFGDYDNDGNLDLYVTNYGPNVLYHNNGNGRFTNVTVGADVGNSLWSTGAAFGDYDQDGDLDLYVCNYVEYDLSELESMQKESIQAGKPVPSALNPHVFTPQDNVLYRNNGDGTFADVTAELGVEAHGGRSLQAIFSDLDLDGDLDLYVANDTSPNFVYRNNGDGTFEDISEASWAADFRGSMGLTSGDYDGDQDLDLFISHWIDEENALYRNLWVEENNLVFKAVGDRNQETFIRLVDESYGAALGEESLKYIGWGTDFFDYDNDGDLDIFVTNGSSFQQLDQPQYLIAQKDQLFRNEDGEIFADVSEASGIASMPLHVGRGATFGDYDNDGDVDIFVVNNHEQAVLLRNEARSYNWLHVKLIGTLGNRDGIGSKIRLRSGNMNQLREIIAGSSYMSFNSLIAEFGLGSYMLVDWLEVRWLNGKIEQFTDIEVNQRITIKEGEGITQIGE